MNQRQHDDLSPQQAAATTGLTVVESPAFTSNKAPKTSIKPVSPTSAPANAVKGKIKPVTSISALAKSAKRNVEANLGKRIQATFPIQKPLKSKYVRVHASEEYRMNNILTYTDPDTGEMYYVSPDFELPESVRDNIKVSNLYAAVTHDGTFFIWYVNHSDTTWYRAALKAIRTATTTWTRVIARKAANTYDLYKPEGEFPEPDWSGLPDFAAMMENAFEDRLITNTDHPVLRKLRGFDDEE